MHDALEFLLSLLNMSGHISATGRWMLSAFHAQSNAAVEFLLGLLAWIAGFVLLVWAAVALS